MSAKQIPPIVQLEWLRGYREGLLYASKGLRKLKVNRDHQDILRKEIRQTTESIWDIELVIHYPWKRPK